MKNKLKINNLYLKDFKFDMLADNIIQSITLDSKEYYVCESGEEALFLKSLISEELNIPLENIQSYAIE